MPSLKQATSSELSFSVTCSLSNLMSTFVQKLCFRVVVMQSRLPSAKSHARHLQPQVLGRVTSMILLGCLRRPCRVSYYRVQDDRVGRMGGGWRDWRPGDGSDVGEKGCDDAGDADNTLFVSKVNQWFGKIILIVTWSLPWSRGKW